MSNATELLRRSLKSLEEGFRPIRKVELIEEIRTFLAAEPEAEPVAWIVTFRRDTGTDKLIVRTRDRAEREVKPDLIISVEPLYLHPPKPAEPEADELKDDAFNLLLALQEAWPYVHDGCTIKSKKERITHLLRKHGDFADLYQPKPTEPEPKEWQSLTDEEISTLSLVNRNAHGALTVSEFARAVEAAVRAKNT